MKKIIGFSFILLLTLAIFSSCAKKTITITYDSQGGSAVPAVEIEKTQALTLPSDPTKSGLLFCGWYTKPQGEGTQVANGAIFSNSATLYAFWATDTVYKITFDPENTKALTVLNVVTDTIITPPENPTRDSYSFNGWYTQENGLGDKLTAETTATSDITYFAFWKPLAEANVPSGKTESPAQLPAVYFSVEGGNQEYNPCVAVSGKVDLPTPLRNNYTFGGWFTGKNGQGTQYTSSTVITKDVRLYAYWQASQDASNQETPVTEPVKCTLTLISQGKVYDTFTVDAGAVQQLPQPSVEGYTFHAWYSGKNQTGNAYTKAITIGGDTTLYADYNKIQTTTTYTVTFHYEDGTGNTLKKTAEEGAAVAMPDNPTREGYKFIIWTASDGSDFTNLSPVTADMDVYAQWEQIAPPEPPQAPEQ